MQVMVERVKDKGVSTACNGPSPHKDGGYEIVVKWGLFYSPCFFVFV